MGASRKTVHDGCAMRQADEMRSVPVVYLSLRCVCDWQRLTARGWLFFDPPTSAC
jgi:hypothetical protein